MIINLTTWPSSLTREDRRFVTKFLRTIRPTGPDPPDELIPQFELVRQATRAFNLDCVELPGYEADDLIATYTRKALEAGADVTIVSSDKDLMQLVSHRVTMLDTIKNRRIGPEQVQEKFGVPPDKVVDVQALAGDSTDNVPGVPGIGIKTAAQLINEYGDLETLLQRASEIKQAKRRENLVMHADKARLSHELVRLRDDVSAPFPLERFGSAGTGSGSLAELFTRSGISIHHRQDPKPRPISRPGNPSFREPKATCHHSTGTISSSV